MEQSLVRKESPDEEQEAPSFVSPFLPNTNIRYLWSASSLEAFKRCPRYYYYTYIEGWDRPSEKVDLQFGHLYHSALERYDHLRLGDTAFDHELALHIVVLELLLTTRDFKPDHKYKNRPNLVRSVIWYLDKFKDDPAKTVILNNGQPAVELPFRFELDWGPEAGKTYIKENVVEHGQGAITYDLKEQAQPYILHGFLDRIVDFQGFQFVMDRKTTKSTPGDYYFDQYSPHTQMTLYTIAGQIVFEMPIKGVIIDAVQVAIDFTRPVRGMTYRTADFLEEWLKDLRFWFAQAEACAVEDTWPQNDTACGMYGGCKFREVCSKSPGVREVYLKSNFVQTSEEERWNQRQNRQS